jgi:hypothetical protein
VTSGELNVILTPTDVAAIQAEIAAGQEPWTSAWTYFRDGKAKSGLNLTIAVYAGPFTGGDIHATFDNSLTPQAAACRNLAIAYAVSGDLRYATKAHDILVAWATGNTPTTQTDYDSVDTGQMQSPGAFSFAYAYSLIRDAPGVFSDADRTVVTSYFQTFIAALKTCMADILRSDRGILTDSQARVAYDWNANLFIRKTDRDVGGDFTMLMDAAMAAMAGDVGDTATLDWLFSSANPLSFDAALSHALQSSNDGDGLGTVPAPESHIAKKTTLDYCTYNIRIADVMAEEGQELGYGTLTRWRGALAASWDWQAQFFGPGAVPSPNPTDVVNTGVDVPRFGIAPRDIGADAQVMRVIGAATPSKFYESQLLGPVTLTHSIPAP